MRKFYIDYHRKTTVIMEVEVEKLSFIEDPWAPIRKPNEWIGKIVAPASIYEKDKISGELKPYTACWFVFHDRPKDALIFMARGMLQSILKKKYYKSLENAEPWTKAENDIMIGIMSGSEDIDKIVAQYKPEIETELSKVEIIML